MTLCYQRATDVLWRRASDRVLLLPCGEGDREVVSLSGTGVVLWDLLADRASMDDLTSTLAVAFGADPVVVATDIAPVLDDLVERRLIATVDEP